MNEQRQPVYVTRPRYTFQPWCPNCHGTGIALRQEGTATGLTVTMSTPCACAQPAGYDVFDVSNVVVISPEPPHA